MSSHAGNGDAGTKAGGAPSLDELFERATELTGPEREALIARTKESDPSLARRLRQLLAAHEAVAEETFLDAPLVSPDACASGVLRPVTEAPGDRIGPYVLRERLGEGGFGVVYRAEQVEPVQREVALKVIKLGMDTREVIRRFEQERRALALTDHPNIARVLDAGATATGRPYFVMELVRGEDVCTFADRRKLSVRARLALFADVCRGVQHAHDRGLVHRDLKPGNVLVTEVDGVPTPKVIDFGVVKASHAPSDATRLATQWGSAVGTPTYMSPEQASFGVTEVDPRSDVYTLGVLLHELLVGCTPLDPTRLAGATPSEIERILTTEQPARPSSRMGRDEPLAAARAAARGTTPAALATELRGDLDWIVLRALETDRDRRYGSVAALAEDVRRSLAREPVEARPPSTAYRARRFLGRHRTAALGVAATTLALVSGTWVATLGYLRAREQADKATSRSAFVQEVLAGTYPPSELERLAREAFGDEHAAVAEALNQAASRFQEEGDLDAAQGLLEQSLAAWTRLGGERHPRVARAHARLARVLHLRGGLEEAERHYRAALEIEDHTSDGGTAGIEVREGLARLLRGRGELEEAALLLGDAIQLREERLPHQRDALSDALEDLWEVLRSAGEDERASTVYRRMIEVSRVAYPADTLVHADQLLVFGRTLASLPGQRQEAKNILREGLDRYRRHGFPPGEGFLGGLQALIGILEDRAPVEPSAEVERLLDEAERVARRLHGSDSLELAKVLEHRAERLARSVDVTALYRAAEREKEAFEIRARALGESFEPEGMLTALRALATRIAQCQDASEEAYHVAVESVDLMLRYAKDPAPLELLQTQLRVRLAADDSEYQEVLEDLEGQRDPRHYALAAIVYHQLRNDATAMAFLREALDLSTRPQWRDDPDLRKLLDEARALLGAR